MSPFVILGGSDFFYVLFYLFLFFTDIHVFTVKIQKIWTLQKFVVITLKSKQGGFTIESCIQKMQTECFQEQSDLGLHCLPRPVCPKT